MSLSRYNALEGCACRSLCRFSTAAALFVLRVFYIYVFFLTDSAVLAQTSASEVNNGSKPAVSPPRNAQNFVKTRPPALTEPMLFLRPAERENLRNAPQKRQKKELSDETGNSADSVSRESAEELAGHNMPAGVSANEKAPVIALTFDLCMGGIDERIFDVLLRYEIPATLFVTGRFLRNKGNIETIEQIRAHPNLFEIGNHGENHIPAVETAGTVYGLRTAGSFQAICSEASGGLRAIKQARLEAQIGKYFWYRGAAALYSAASFRFLQKMGFSIAGFSRNIDEGASVSAETALRHSLAAQDGDVLIAHMNKPARPAGAGVAAGIKALREKGYHFVKLSQAETMEENAPSAVPLSHSYGREPLPRKMSRNNSENFYPNCAVLLR